MLYGVLDVSARRFSFACAAHPSPAFLPVGGAPRVLHASGLPIGIVPGAEWEEAHVDLEPGDRLFLYSDGLTEATDPDEQEFRVERLLDEIARTRELPLDTSVATIVAAVQDWSGPEGHSDDITVVAFELE